MWILAAYHLKGGVGKTATAVNLAWLCARAGYRTLLWDLDPQAAATFYFRVKPKVKGGARKLIRRRRRITDAIRATDLEGLDLIPADFSLRHLDLELDAIKKPKRRLARIIGPLVPYYDFLFLDCAPSISLVSENVFRAADALVIPLIPTTLSLRTYRRLVEHLVESDLGAAMRLPFFSMVDLRKRLHRETLESFRADAPELLHATVPNATEVERMGVARAPVVAFAPGSKPAAAYEALWQEIRARL